MNINTDSHKDPDQLEREVDERRAHLGATLHALEERLSPGHIFDQVLEYSRKNGGDFSQNLVNTVKNNPVPTILTAVGVAWLLYGQNKPSSQYSNNATNTGSNMSGSNLKDQGKHMKDSVAHSFSNAKHHVAHTAEEVRHQAHRASAGFSSLLHEQPLAAGAIGIAIGALIGGVLPSTRYEDNMIGGTRDQLAHKAASAAKDTYRKASATGREMMGSTRDEYSVDDHFSQTRQ